MNATEVSKVLARMALYDNRKVGDLDVIAWLDVIGDLPFADAEQAVITHYQESRERIMPADVRQRVKAVRAERLRVAAPDLVPPAELLDDTDAYREWLRDHTRRVADGAPTLRAIGDAS
jgi:hypothetical protein